MKRALFFLAAFLVCSATNLGAQTTVKRPDHVHATVKAEKPDNNGIQKISVTLTIDKGWHIYANPAGHEDLVGHQTNLQIYQDGNKRMDAKITYPKGQPMDVYGIKFYIYTEKVVLQVDVPRTTGDPKPLEIRVALIPHSRDICGWPRELKLAVP